VHLKKTNLETSFFTGSVQGLKAGGRCELWGNWMQRVQPPPCLGAALLHVPSSPHDEERDDRDGRLLSTLEPIQ
jgi:hypothetical protein